MTAWSHAAGLPAAVQHVLLALLPEAADADRWRMQPMGWVFMIGSIGLVVLLTAYCYYMVLTRPEAADQMHAPLDIDTRDREP